MSGSKSRISTSPQWGVMLLFFIMIVALVMFYKHDVLHPQETDSPMLLDEVIFYSVLCGHVIVIFAVHHTFSEKYLIVRFLGVPFRFIPWNRVSGAIYLHTWYESRQGQFRTRYSPTVVHDSAIFVSLGYCRQFDPQYDTRWRFRMLNPFTTLFIRLPEKKAEEYVKVFQRYYPDLMIQPVESQK